MVGFIDEAELKHATDDPVAADHGAIRIGHWVIARWCFGQAGNHRHFGDSELRDGLAIINFGGSTNAIGALT